MSKVSAETMMHSGLTWITAIVTTASIVPAIPPYWKSKTRKPGRKSRMFILTPSARLCHSASRLLGEALPT